MYVQPVVEDLVQELILQKLFTNLRPDLRLHPAIGKRGNSYIKEKLRNFNNACESLPHAILTDLDRALCAPQLIAEWVNFRLSSKLLFRVAEKEAETWLLADQEGFSSYLSVPLKKIPVDSESIEDPKAFIVSLATKSKRKEIRDDIIPIGQSKVGPGYNLALEKFIIRYWDFNNASKNSKSLQKTILRIQTFLH